MGSVALSTQAYNLYILLLGIGAEKLGCLDDENIAWLGPLRELPPYDIPHAICDAVKAGAGEGLCLLRIAWLRCRLLRWHRHTAWRIHQLKAAPAEYECHAILAHMAHALRGRKREATLSWTTSGDAITACMLTEKRAHESLKHTAVYVVLWPSRPLLGVNYLGVGMKETVLVALHAALGYDALELSSVQEDSIDEAFRSANRVLIESFGPQEKALYVEGAPHSSTDAHAGCSVNAAASVPEEAAVIIADVSCGICPETFRSRAVRNEHLRKKHRSLLRRRGDEDDECQ